jgi:hypothetical protein
MQPALSEVAARPDSDTSLEEVVPRTQRIAVGVEEDVEPPALVAVQQKRKRGRDTTATAAIDTPCDRRAPPTNSMPNSTAMKTIVVPRSGCVRISAAGGPTAASTSAKRRHESDA